MDRNRIVVMGGGIAGVETALTLARTAPRAQVTLVSKWPSLRVTPLLVYVPFGGSEHGIDVRLDQALAPEGVELVAATCERVDRALRQVVLSSGVLEYDTLVVAPGTVSEAISHHRLRSLEDAQRLRQALEVLATQPAWDRSVMLRVPASCTWPAPAFELALLLGRWRAEHGLDDVRITLAIEDIEPLEPFGIDASDILLESLSSASIELLTHVPNHRMDQIPASVAIDFGGLGARRVFGMPHVDTEGFYGVDATGLVAPDVYVVGDAAATDYKAAFATGWQARRIAAALGGDVSLLGDDVGGVPVDQAEYQMDLGDGTLEVAFAAPYVGPNAHDLRATHAARVTHAPEKLTGTLTHALVESASQRASQGAARG